MSDEKIENRECICKNECFKRFLSVAAGVFVGVYCALCLFCATHRPPIPPQLIMPQPYPVAPMMIQGADCPCHKKMMKKMMKDYFNQSMKFDSDIQPNE